MSIGASITRDSSDEAILYALRNVANIAQLTISAARDWSMNDAARGQYAADVMVNDAVVAALREFGWGILSEESGASGFDATEFADLGHQLVVVVDPIDGSTNASRGIAWHAVSLCCVDAEGPRAAVVAQLAQPHTEYAAVRGKGAWKNGEVIRRGEARQFENAVVGVSGPPPAKPGWWQFRANGAAALDLCLVADGSFTVCGTTQGHFSSVERLASASSTHSAATFFRSDTRNAARPSPLHQPTRSTVSSPCAARETLQPLPRVLT